MAKLRSLGPVGTAPTTRTNNAHVTVAIGKTADISGQLADANDPFRKSSGQSCCDAQPFLFDVAEYDGFTACFRELGWIAHERGTSMFSMFKRKSPTAMDAFIRTIYGANPPRKSADLERSVTIAHEDLLFERVPLPEVKRVAGELFQGQIPYSTHDLAVSTALAFFKAPGFVPVLTECQIPARLRVVNWAKDRKVVGPLAQSFEAVLYRVYKPSQQEAPERSVLNQEAERKVQDAPTVKDLLIARAPPWNRVAPVVIKTILAAITDKGLLEAFVQLSMNAGLVATYEALGGDSDPTVIRAQISQVLCETGNRAIPTLTKALGAKQMEAATKALMLAGDAFEAAMTLAKNQIAAYAGLATIYELVGKEVEAQKYARLGLSELGKMRQDPASRALRDGIMLPADILDQMERRLRACLANQ
jgi:hypothetical protein